MTKVYDTNVHSEFYGKHTIEHGKFVVHGIFVIAQSKRDLHKKSATAVPYET